MKISKEIKVPCFMVDNSRRIRPSAVADICQEMALNGADALGFGFDTLVERDVAWVLSRMHIVFDSYPRWKDVLTVNTWHKGLDSLFFIRDYELLSPSGERLVRATSSWVVINTRTRAFVRAENLGDIISFQPQDGDNALEERADRIRIPKEAGRELILEHKVSYSDVDIIGHANNVRYISWAMDCLPDPVSHPVRELTVNFLKETRLGDEIKLYRTECGDAVYVEGESGGNPVFSVKFICK